MQNGLFSRPRVVDKNSGGISQEQGDPHQAHQPRIPVLGRWVPTTSGCKNQWGLSLGKKLLEPQAVPLKEPTHRLTYSDSLALSSSTGVAAWRAPVAHWEKVKCLAWGWAQAIVLFLSPLPTEPWGWQAGAIFDTPLTWLILFDPPWRSPETLPHPTYRPTQAAFPYQRLVLAHASQLPKSIKQATAGLSELQGGD